LDQSALWWFFIEGPSIGARFLMAWLNIQNGAPDDDGKFPLIESFTKCSHQPEENKNFVRGEHKNRSRERDDQVFNRTKCE
jgi:hypothetical protein